MSKIFLCTNNKCLWGGEIIENGNSGYRENKLRKIMNNICPDCGGVLSQQSKAIRNYSYIYYRGGSNLMIRSICPGLPRSEYHIEAADAVELKEFIKKYI